MADEPVLYATIVMPTKAPCVFCGETADTYNPEHCVCNKRECCAAERLRKRMEKIRRRNG